MVGHGIWPQYSWSWYVGHGVNFTFSHRDLATVRLILISDYIHVGCAFVHIFVHGPGYLATLCFYGHSIWPNFVLWPRYLATLCFYGHGIWPHFVLWPRHLAAVCFVDTVFGCIFVLWPRYIAPFCLYGHGIWPHFVCMATAFGRSLFYGHGIWPHFVFQPWYLALSQNSE